MGEDFNPEVGFLENKFGYRRMHSACRRPCGRKDLGLGFRELLPHVIYTRNDYLDGGLNTAEIHMDNHWDWENGYFVDTAIHGTWEGLLEPSRSIPASSCRRGTPAAGRFR